ncbi:MAG: hypothetical protein RLZZ106_571 [Cyanobacteriota bacterium]|jgi:hypothetical protein
MQELDLTPRQQQRAALASWLAALITVQRLWVVPVR